MRGIQAQLGSTVPLTLRSSSIFHHANNTVVCDGTFYAAHNLTIKQVQGEKLPWLTHVRSINMS